MSENEQLKAILRQLYDMQVGKSRAKDLSPEELSTLNSIAELLGRPKLETIEFINSLDIQGGKNFQLQPDFHTKSNLELQKIIESSQLALVNNGTIWALTKEFKYDLDE